MILNTIVLGIIGNQTQRCQKTLVVNVEILVEICIQKIVIRISLNLNELEWGRHFVLD